MVRRIMLIGLTSSLRLGVPCCIKDCVETDGDVVGVAELDIAELDIAELDTLPTTFPTGATEDAAATPAPVIILLDGMAV